MLAPPAERGGAERGTATNNLPGFRTVCTEPHTIDAPQPLTAAPAQTRPLGQPLELNSGLRFHTLLPEGVAQQLHLRHQVGTLQQTGGGTATGERHVGEGRP